MSFEAGSWVVNQKYILRTFWLNNYYHFFQICSEQFEFSELFSELRKDLLKDSPRYEVRARERGRVIFEVDPEDKMNILRQSQRVKGKVTLGGKYI